MKTIKIAFTDFWPNFIPTDNYFYNLLTLKYNVVIDYSNPDIVFHSVYNKKYGYNWGGDVKHLKYDKNSVIKILYTGENIRPDYDETHFSFSFDYLDDERNYRLPLWALILNWFDRTYIENRDHAYLHNLKDFLDNKRYEKNKFCAFVASNPAGKRMEFVPKLIKRNYKPINCAGTVYNNTPKISGRGDTIEKVEFLKPYKFNICFENSSKEGYTTEKIIHPMFMGTIPVYWGDPLVTNDFNPDSFLNWFDYNDDEKLIDRIIELDTNDKMYEEMIMQPWFKNNVVPDFIKPESVLSFLEKIITYNK